MHMADALLSPVTGAVMAAASFGAMGYSAFKIKQDDLCEKKVPVMAVTGAFVFAAQMINFTIPGTGSSGHIGGGILLAAMLGGFPSLLTIAAVLIIQALFFADGGLLALGCNMFNMGVIPCLLVYPLLFRFILRKGITYKRLAFASILSVVIALQLGAFSVVLETACLRHHRSAVWCVCADDAAHPSGYRRCGRHRHRSGIVLCISDATGINR